MMMMNISSIISSERGDTNEYLSEKRKHYSINKALVWPGGKEPNKGTEAPIHARLPVFGCCVGL